MRTLFLGLTLLASPAWAGTITFQVVEGGQANATKVYTILDADIDRLVAAYQIDANASVNATATRAQVLNFWITRFVTDTVNTVKSYELKKAQDAVAVPTPINPQ